LDLKSEGFTKKYANVFVLGRDLDFNDLCRS